jgi:purine-nucleoside phosphorylase
MAIHIAAEKGAIAERVLLPGDPLRAQVIAEQYLENAVCYNTVRNMLGFTGSYKGRLVSVQGTGMGIPSISIYANELFREYGVKQAIRIGTAGSLSDDVKIRDVVLATAASTDSGANKRRFNGISFAPSANFTLLKTAHDIALQKGTPVKTGSVFTSDMFYKDDHGGEPDWKLLSKYGALAIEMETAELYTLAAQFNVKALAILTISDSMISGETTGADERQKDFKQMMEIALETITKE